MRQIGIISGLKSELRCLGFGLDRPAHLVTFAAAGSPERARARALGWAADGRLRALMSFGLCGGLDPALEPGHVVVAHRIALPEGGALDFDPRWAHAIAARIAGARVAPLLGAGDVAATAAEKHALFERHAVPAIDMESRGVAEAAHEAGVPFVALRAVADPAQRTLPKVAARAIDARGRVRPFRVLLGLLARPHDLPALIALGTDARRGYEALAAAGMRALLPDLVPQPAAATAPAGALAPALALALQSA
jgi:adenosylhomocysteine nucleosidase